MLPKMGWVIFRCVEKNVHKLTVFKMTLQCESSLFFELRNEILQSTSSRPNEGEV